MVYGDLNTPDFNVNSPSTRYQAGPFARCFSAVLDYVIFFPVVTFFITIFFKDSVVILGSAVSSGTLSSLLVQLFAFYVLLFTFLQTLFIYFYSATPGQSYLKLFIQFETRQSNLFFQIWLRQLGFVLSLFGLGLPFLAVFYHAKQRPFYDRLSECDVLTRAPVEHLPLQEMDKRYLSAGLSALICFFSSIFLFSLIQSHYFSATQLHLAAKPKDIHKECIVVENQGPEDRLRSALALNILNRLPSECVDSEADSILEDPKTALKTLAYFAKYYTEENAEDKKKYLKLACLEGNPSDLCQKPRTVATISNPENLWEKLIKRKKEQK